MLDRQVVRVDPGIVDEDSEITGQLVGVGDGDVQAPDLKPSFRLAHEVTSGGRISHGGNGRGAPVCQLDGNRPPDAPTGASDQRASSRVHLVALRCWGGLRRDRIPCLTASSGCPGLQLSSSGRGGRVGRSRRATINGTDAPHLAAPRHVSPCRSRSLPIRPPSNPTRSGRRRSVPGNVAASPQLSRRRRSTPGNVGGSRHSGLGYRDVISRPGACDRAGERDTGG